MITNLWQSLSESTRGRLLVLSAAILWSSSGAFVKSTQLPASDIAMYRCLSAGLILLAYARFRKIPLSWHPWMLVMMIAFAVMNYAFIASMTLTTAANTIFLQYTAPAWVFLASAFFLGEPLSRKNLMALVGAMVGIGILVLGEWSTDQQQAGILLGLLSGVTYACVAVSLRILRSHHSLWLATLNHLAAGLLLLLAISVTSDAPLRIIQLTSGSDYVFLSTFGMCQMAVPYVLFGFGLRYVDAQEAALLTLAEPLLNPVWTYWVAGEQPSVATVIGGSVVLLTLTVRYFPAETAPPPATPPLPGKLPECDDEVTIGGESD